MRDLEGRLGDVTADTIDVDFNNIWGYLSQCQVPVTTTTTKRHTDATNQDLHSDQDGQQYQAD